MGAFDHEEAGSEPTVGPFCSAETSITVAIYVLGERFGRRPDGRGAITTRRSRGPGGCGAGPSASPRAGSPARTSGSARGPANPALRFFGRRQLVGAMADHGHHGKSQHRQRDVPMPAMPGPRLVVIEPKLGLRRLERMASRPEEFHLRPLTERCGSLSAHTAPTKQPRVMLAFSRPVFVMKESPVVGRFRQSDAH